MARKEMKRARGGEMPRAHDDMMREHVEKAQKRKHGGKVHGEKSMPRPDRRARGGAMASDKEPFTTAGKMSKMPYETRNFSQDDHGKGTDKGD